MVIFTKEVCRKLGESAYMASPKLETENVQKNLLITSTVKTGGKLNHIIAGESPPVRATGEVIVLIHTTLLQ